MDPSVNHDGKTRDPQQEGYHGHENPWDDRKFLNSYAPPDTPVGQRFSVEQVKNNMDDDESEDIDSGTQSRGFSDSQSRPISIMEGTIGYATNEAVPMTVFYRNEDSQRHGIKQRPTLKELQKGFGEDPEQQVRNSKSFRLLKKIYKTNIFVFMLGRYQLVVNL